jgi:hypothetical protein
MGLTSTYTDVLDLAPVLISCVEVVVTATSLTSLNWFTQLYGDSDTQSDGMIVHMYKGFAIAGRCATVGLVPGY